MLEGNYMYHRFAWADQAYMYFKYPFNRCILFCLDIFSNTFISFSVSSLFVFHRDRHC